MQIDPLKRLLSSIVANHGYLDVAQLADLAKLDRLRMVLIRCGNGRFLCPAQNAEHFMNIIRRDFDAHSVDCDYIRDVSLPSSDPAHKGGYEPRTVEGSYSHAPAPKPAKPVQATRSSPRNSYVPVNEEYSGTFDGFGVVSDADPGL